MRVEGVVKWFDIQKGYGFITVEGSEDLFVHYSAIAGTGFRTLVEGAHVDCEVESSQRGLQARDVVVRSQPERGAR